MKRILLLLALLVPFLGQAQLLNPVTWTYALEPPSPKIGQTAEVVFTAKIEKGWHLYANDFSEDVGPIPLRFDFKPDASYELVGKAVPVKPHHYQDEIFGGEVSDWAGTGVVRQKIKIKALPVVFAGTLDGQACTDAGKCVPISDDFSITGKPQTTEVKQLAKPNEAPIVKDGKEIPVTASERKAIVEHVQQKAELPNSDSGSPLIDPETGQIATKQEIDSQATAQTPIVLDDEKQISNTAKATPTQASADMGGDLWSWFFVAFGSGLIALLTPCVYPMVPMTVSFFTRKGQSRAKGFGMAALFGLSIVTLYVLIGVVVSRLFGGDVANDIATHWIPNVLFFLIFLTFGFSFLGYFEITLPSAWSTATDERAEKGGIVGIFFMALTLVVVSFSCTGPIASGILLASSQGAVVQPVVAMLGFSLAFALPFTFFAAFPHAMQALPRSGAWMNSVKVVLGFVELALALKFLSVADLAYHWHILDREVYLSLWIVIFSLLGFYLLGKIKFPHDDAEEKPVGWVSLSMATLVFAFVVYLVPGLWGAPLKALSGYLPPLETQDFRPNSQASTGASGAAPAPTAGCPAPKYADFLHLPHGLQGYFDLDQALACAKATGKPVFIDFTGHGCTNCREMEARVWSDPAILARLRDKFTVVALYVDDRTALPESEQYTSKVDGKVKATIGKRNLDMEVARFASNAQPQYVILSPDGDVLAGPRPYDLDVAAFAAFLDGGLAKAGL